MLFIVRQNQSEESNTSWLKTCELKGGKEKTNLQDSGEATFFFVL